ncbi:MAG: hypothetical protein LH632_15330 [Rhodoferax sp.]|nr:hypothetical protein [Rhodoferax sp.]
MSVARRPAVASHRGAQFAIAPGSVPECLQEPAALLRVRRAEQGFAAIAALFILVVLAALGAFMVSVSSSQQITSAQDIQGSRAYWAARAGVEWALGSLSVAPAACPTPPVPFVVEGFTLVVSCARSAFDEGGATRLIYAISSRATLGGSPGAIAYVERSVSASVEF